MMLLMLPWHGFDCIPGELEVSEPGPLVAQQGGPRIQPVARQRQALQPKQVHD